MSIAGSLDYWGFVSYLVADWRLWAAGAAVFGAAVGWRWLVRWWWRTGLRAYRLRFPAGLDADQVTACLGSLGAASGRRPVALEIVGTRDGIDHYLITPAVVAGERLRLLRSLLPGIRATAAPLVRLRARAAAELAVTAPEWPLATERVPEAVSGFLAALQPLYTGEAVRAQVIVRGARSGAPPHPHRTDSDVRAAWRTKHDGAMCDAVVRVTVTAKHYDRARHLLARLVSTLATMNAVARIRRRALPGLIVASRADRKCLPVFRWPLFLNAAELTGFAGIPLGDAQIAGLVTGVARQIAPHVNIPKFGTVIADSNYPGSENRALAVKVADRLMHSYFLGPTGSGKSTLLSNLAGQDIAAGFGVFVIDPKEDLIAEILARVPDERVADVIVLDASNTRHPVGINLLGSPGRGEHARDLVVDQAVSVMADIWRSSWGPRTSDLLRNALLTLTATRAPDGSAFTMAEVPELLTNTQFRAWVLDHAQIPAPVAAWWRSYEEMTSAARYDVIGPAMNKLRSLTTRTALRLILGQSGGVDLATEVFTRRRVVLVSLAKGVIGAETANLLGSLIFTRLWNAALARAGIPAKQRRPVFGYLDEFQDVVRLASTDLADTLAQARGLGLGLTLAHQYLGQIPDTVRDAVMGTVRTSGVVEGECADARELAPRYAPGLDVADLSGADAYELALRVCVNSQTLPPVTGRTRPLPEPIRDPRRLATDAARRYGTPRRDVERALRARTGPDRPATLRRTTAPSTPTNRTATAATPDEPDENEPGEVN